MGNKGITEMWREACADGERRPSVTYVLVVDDHAILTCGLVGTHVLLDAPVTAPPAQNTTTATVNRRRSLQPPAAQQDACWTFVQLTSGGGGNSRRAARQLLHGSTVEEGEVPRSDGDATKAQGQADCDRV